MNNSAKQKLINSVLYVALALIAVAIMCVSIFSFATAANKTKSPVPNTEETEREIRETEKPKDSSKEAEQLEEKETDGKETEKAEKDDPDTPSDPVSAEELLFNMPVLGTVSKGYSNEVAVYSLTMNDYRTHSGIDICARVGSPVSAAADGTISNVYDSLFMGKCISIDHSNGISTHYMGLSEEIPDDIFIGAEVSRGQVIAGIGETALVECADSPHLHFEISVDGIVSDPSEYLDLGEAVSANLEE